MSHIILTHREAADRWEDEFKDIEERTDTAREKALEGARRRLRNLINAQLEDPSMFTPEEFKSEKAKISSEIVRVETEGAASAERKANAYQSVVNATRFAASARERFDSGDADVRRRVISQLGQNYFLTLGKLEFTTHPLLRPFVTIEPLEIGSDKVKSPSSTPLNPCWGAIREGLRNLIYEQDLEFPAWEADKI